ncbi:MAG TPA: hypothetical protein VN748_04770 [Pseudonocardiaceae bacterium]|jgi:hypothetical protein|nr:hypothetical protein [Pseudonocardiaceae bacterium]
MRFRTLGGRWLAALLTLLGLVLAIVLVSSPTALGAPASAQVPGVDDCKQAPNPERPGSGMVGAIDPTPLQAGAPNSVYAEVGYAGLVWHTYDLGCGPSGLRNPNAVIDTWTGNLLFDIGKVIVGATNGLHYALGDGGLLAPLNDLIVSGTVALYDSVYAPWFGLIAVLLAIVLFRSIWRGDLATVSKRAAWALAGIWLAAATYLTPLLYTQVLDGVLVDGSNQVRTGFLHEVGIAQRDALPTLLHEQIIYRNWLRGEFGSPDGPQAAQLGRDLVRAQAFTKQEIAAAADDPTSGVTDRKKQEYKAIADRTGSAYGYFQGVDGNRIGVGFLAALQAVMFGMFQLLAQAALLLAQVLLRVVILLGPIIGLIAILHHDLLRGVGRAVGAAVLNIIVLSALAALHTLVMVWVFDPSRNLSVLAQMLLAGMITLVMLLVARPVRRMWQMTELAVGAVGGALPAAPPGVLARLRRHRPGVEASASERFWEEARAAESDPGAATAGSVLGNVMRPEAGAPVVLAGQRLDRRAGLPLLSPGGSPGGPDHGAAALPGPATSPPKPDRLAALPPGFSVTGRARTGDEPVYVPSAVSDLRATPRQAELEEVAGRPVWVVYRPSAGLEMGTPRASDVPSAKSTDNSRTTD